MTTPTTTTTTTRLLFALALLATAAAPTTVRAQKEQKLTVALYAPSAAFADSGARLAYVQGLARAIQTKTGIPTEGKAYVRYEDMKKANPDFAIVEGLCIAVRKPGTLLAQAAIGGATTQKWALFGRTATSFASLAGKKLAYVKTGCRDNDFLENAMLDSEIRLGYFGSLVDKPDVAGAVASVRDFKQAEAVFAPANAARGLNKLFEAGNLPTPGFVQMNVGVPATVVAKVKEAVLSYGAGGGIDGWKAPSQQSYEQLAAALGARVKRPIFALPDVVRIEDEDVLVIPSSEFEQASVRQHFWAPR